MDKGTHFQKREHRLTPWAAVALALMLVLSVGGTVAYLSTATGSVTNTFTPTPVECMVIEDPFDQGKSTLKTNVSVQNTGKADAHIRATIVVTWQDAAGNVYGQVPVEGEGKDYVLVINDTGWEKGADGYWYCIAAGNLDTQTAVLIKSCTALTSLDGYTLNVEILAQAIQAEPDAAAIAAWGEANVAGLAVIRAGGVQQ